MSRVTNRVEIEVKLATPQIQYVNLKVLKHLEIDRVFYAQGDVIQVTHREAVALLTNYPDHFQEVTP